MIPIFEMIKSYTENYDTKSLGFNASIWILIAFICNFYMNIMNRYINLWWQITLS